MTQASLENPPTHLTPSHVTGMDGTSPQHLPNPQESLTLDRPTLSVTTCPAGSHTGFSPSACLVYSLHSPFPPPSPTFYEKPDLDDVVVAVFSVHGLHGANVEASKHLSAGVHPLPISGTQRAQEQIRRGAESAVTSGDTVSGRAGGRAGGPPRPKLRRVTPPAYLSVMAICSSMAEPVLAFQFPEMEVLLRKRAKKSLVAHY